MRIVIPYVPGMLREPTRAWGERNGAQFVELLPNEPSAYYWALAVLWDGCHNSNDDLMIVEHDIVPNESTLRGFLHCKRPWCLCPYSIGGDVASTAPMLGCVRFSARLIRRHWGALVEVGNIADDGLPAKDWRRLDGRIARVLQARGCRPHRHGEVVHLHPYVAPR